MAKKLREMSDTDQARIAWWREQIDRSLLGKPLHRSTDPKVQTIRLQLDLQIAVDHPTTGLITYWLNRPEVAHNPLRGISNVTVVKKEAL